MRVPHTQSRTAGLRFQLLLACVLLGRFTVTFELLELGPAVLEDLGGDVAPGELGGTDVPGDRGVVGGGGCRGRGWEGVRDGEGDLFADEPGAEEFAGLEGPGLWCEEKAKKRGGEEREREGRSVKIYE
jgi:hypothetical protein